MIAPEVPGRWRFMLAGVPVVIRTQVVALPAIVLAVVLWVLALPSPTVTRFGLLALAGLTVALFPHEAAHAAAGISLGLRPYALVLRGTGLAVSMPDELWASPWRVRARVLMAGPASDLTLAVVLAAAGYVALLTGREALMWGLLGAAVGPLMLMLANLLPVPPTDMWRLLRAPPHLG